MTNHNSGAILCFILISYRTGNSAIAGLGLKSH